MMNAKRSGDMYKVIPWDDVDNVREFDSWIDAYQYGSIKYGMRFDLIEV